MAHAEIVLPAGRPSRVSVRPGSGPLRRTVAYVAFSVAMSFAACSVTPNPVLIREPRPQQLPLRIGVHYPHDLRTFSYQQKGSPRVLMTSFSLGEPSVRLLHDALTLLFLEVVELSAAPEPGARGRDDLAAVIEPRITTTSYSFKTFPGTGVCVGEGCVITGARISYGFTLWRSEGTPLASWVVSGTGGPGVGATLGAKVGSSFEQAMRDAAWNLTSGIRDVPEIHSWLEAQGVR